MFEYDQQFLHLIHYFVECFRDRFSHHFYSNDLPSVAVRSDLDSYVDDSELHLVFKVEDVDQILT